MCVHKRQAGSILTLSPPTCTQYTSKGAVESFYNDLQLSLKYFSKVEHWKELVLIPYRPSKKRRKLKKRHQDTVIETTIFTDRATGKATVMVTKKNRGGKNGDRRERRVERTFLESSGTYHHSSLLRSEIASSFNKEEGTSPAKEVEEYNRHHVYYANSIKPRTPRPPGVKFRVGEVVVHKTEEYTGVIVGWDNRCRVRNGV